MYVSATGVKSLSSPGISTFGNMHNSGGFPDCWYLAAFSTQLKEFGKSLTELFGTVTQCASADGTEACRFPYVDKTREKIIFIISILINRCHGFNTMPGCLKIAASVLQLYFFPIFCFSFPYFFPHFPRGHLHLLVIPYEVGLFLFINDCVKFLFYPRLVITFSETHCGASDLLLKEKHLWNSCMQQPHGVMSWVANMLVTSASTWPVRHQTLALKEATGNKQINYMGEKTNSLSFFQPKLTKPNQHLPGSRLFIFHYEMIMYTFQLPVKRPSV